MRLLDPPLSIGLYAFEVGCPFEVVDRLQVWVRPEHGGMKFSATIEGVGVSGYGDLPSDAVESFKDLLFRAYQAFESVQDDQFGPALLRQKQHIFGLIRRKEAAHVG